MGCSFSVSPGPVCPPASPIKDVGSGTNTPMIETPDNSHKSTPIQFRADSGERIESILSQAADSAGPQRLRANRRRTLTPEKLLTGSFKSKAPGSDLPISSSLARRGSFKSKVSIEDSLSNSPRAVRSSRRFSFSRAPSKEVVLPGAATARTAEIVSKGAAKALNVDVSSTALGNAASKGDIQALRDIRDAGGDVNLGDFDMRTALHLVSCEGKLSVVKALIEELGAEHSPVDINGNSPLDEALRYKHVLVSEYLKEQGAVKKPESVDVSFAAMRDAASFSKESELLDWLAEVGVDASTWGMGGAKTVKSLLDELTQKESTLQRQIFRKGDEAGEELVGGKAIRRLRVVKLVVRPHAGAPRHLACYRQLMSDGRMRKRNVLLSEKLVAGEDPKEAALRGMLEEMGDLAPDAAQVEIVHNSMLVWDELVESPSYPSLITQYQLHQIEVIVPGLPLEPFKTIEGKKEHFWEWRSDSDDDLRRKAPP